MSLENTKIINSMQPDTSGSNAYIWNFMTQVASYFQTLGFSITYSRGPVNGNSYQTATNPWVYQNVLYNSTNMLDTSIATQIRLLSPGGGYNLYVVYNPASGSNAIQLQSYRNDETAPIYQSMPQTLAIATLQHAYPQNHQIHLTIARKGTNTFIQTKHFQGANSQEVIANLLFTDLIKTSEQAPDAEYCGMTSVPLTNQANIFSGGGVVYRKDGQRDSRYGSVSLNYGTLSPLNSQMAGVANNGLSYIDNRNIIMPYYLQQPHGLYYQDMIYTMQTNLEHVPQENFISLDDRTFWLVGKAGTNLQMIAVEYD
ncbi:MAG: hypothetical protein FWH20_00245 [Oscillospiraceae bacterium]|nr:hypothetical protein [Oscillospiraceae bacterium]